MISRVHTALDVKKAIDGASRNLTKIGFDASVLEYGYSDIEDTLKVYADRSPSPQPDENILAVPGGGKIDTAQMVCHRRVVSLQVPNNVSRSLQESLDLSASRITIGIRAG